MTNFTTKFIISSIDKSSSILLNNPYMFNCIRYLLAGKQKGMKRFIKNYLDKYKCKSIVDLCSGTGDFAGLAHENAYYVGWDINKDFVNFAKKRYLGKKNKSFTIVDILNPKNKEEKFDAVLLISAIHHFSDDDLKIILPLVNKMVKKVVIIADIIPDAPHLLQKFFAKIDRGKFVRPAKEKIRILEKYFKVIKTQEIPTRTAVQFGIICEKK